MGDWRPRLGGARCHPARGLYVPLQHETSAGKIQRVIGGSRAGMAITLDGCADGFEVGPHAVPTDRGSTRVPREAGSRAASRKLGVLVGSDDPFTRQAFRAGASGRRIEVLAEGTVKVVADELAPQLEPDIVLMDVQMAAAQGLCAIRQIRARVPNTRILACSAPAGTEFGMLCLSAGAWGYVSKEIDLALLPRILRALAAGEAVIPRELATELVKRFVRPIQPDRLTAGELTAPECRLLELLRTGLNLPEAAAELGVTLATSRRHLGSARRKLSVPSPASTRGTPWSRRRIGPHEG